MNEEIKAAREEFQKAFLIGIQFPQTTCQEVEDHLNELESLVVTLGVEIAGREIVRLSKPSPQYLVGKGKAENLAALCKMLEVDLVIFDDDLSAPQQHLWEKKAECAVIDRRKVIIDIFAQRAQSREARLQVELASLEYMLPRLKRAWTHLERQRGGGGFVGGAGEAQIEVDRRIVRNRISRLRREIDEVRSARKTQRKSRKGRPIPSAALVGYTNSGKSSLLNSLTDAGVLEEDKLFATLDPTTRRIETPNNQPMLLTDTVGFIRKLPPTLVEAFKSTLEEAVEADFLIHVVDANHPKAHEHYRVTNQILEELGGHDKPTILVLNKIDLLDPQSNGHSFEANGELQVRTSTRTGQGLEALLHALGSLLTDLLEDLHLRIPTSRFDVVSELHREGEVLEEKYDSSNVHIHALFPRRFLSRVAEFKTAPPAEHDLG